MIIYNIIWLSNLLLRDVVEREYEEGTVPETEYQAVRNRYAIGFYMPNIFVRIGFFILTVVISFFGSLFITLPIAQDSGYFFRGWLTFLGVLHYVALEVLVRRLHHFQSGADDALLWISAGLLLAAFEQIVNPIGIGGYLAVSLFALLLASFLAIRFTDCLMGLAAYVALLAVVFFGWQQFGGFGRATLPFVLMGFSAVPYWLVQRNLLHPQTLYYKNSMTLLQVAALVILYLAGNYFVVRELNQKLNGGNAAVPLGWLFWGWTMLIPFAYIGAGIRKKDSILLRTGLILAGVSALTFRQYYHLMPAEVALIVGGALILCIAVALFRYLKIPRNRFTAKQQSPDGLFEQLQVESLVIANTVHDPVLTPETNGTGFGGGQFGGGGASGGY